MHRSLPFVLCVLLAAGAVAAGTYYLVPPIQRIPCDPENVLQSQFDTLDVYAHWFKRNLLLLAGLTGVLTAAAFYLQLLRRIAGKFASLSRLLLCVGLGWLAGWFVVDVTATWALRQTGSCLVEAIRVPTAAHRITISDVLPVLARPDAWRAAMTVDMGAIVLLGGLAGLFVYWASWRTRRF